MANRTLTISTTAGDCWTNKPSIGTFDSTSGDLYVAGTSGATDDIKTWIPFVVPLPKNKVIVSATLRVVATGTDTFACNGVFGCEAADNPSAPVSHADLWARTMTTANSTLAIPIETVGVSYDFDVTAAVQEVLNRAGWANSNTLAVFITDPLSSVRWRRWASFENATYTEPQLLITSEYFLPQGSVI